MGKKTEEEVKTEIPGMIGENNPRYKSLYNQWISEGKPGQLVTGSETFSVNRLDGVKFVKITTGDYYQSVTRV